MFILQYDYFISKFKQLIIIFFDILLVLEPFATYSNSLILDMFQTLPDIVSIHNAHYDARRIFLLQFQQFQLQLDLIECYVFRINYRIPGIHSNFMHNIVVKSSESFDFHWEFLGSFCSFPLGHYPFVNATDALVLTTIRITPVPVQVCITQDVWFGTNLLSAFITIDISKFFLDLWLISGFN